MNSELLTGVAIWWGGRRLLALLLQQKVKLVLEEAAWLAGKEKSGEGLKKGKNNSCWHSCSVETNGCGAVISILRSSIEVGECRQNGELRKL
jgi:hypothetical protein